MKKNRILIITEGFFPGKNYGGPPVSVNNFCSLMEGFECFIVTRDHDLGEKSDIKAYTKGGMIETIARCSI